MLTSLRLMSGETLISGDMSIDCAPGLLQLVGLNDEPMQSSSEPSSGRGRAMIDETASSIANKMDRYMLDSRLGSKCVLSLFSKRQESGVKGKT